MKTGVFLCTCSGTINIDYKKLKKSITADVVEIHNLLCYNDGLARISETIKSKELGRALIACTSRREVFESLGPELQFINIREHCAYVHEKKDATEKAKHMILEALHSFNSTEKIIINVGRELLITGEMPAAMKIAQDMSKIMNVHVLCKDTCEFGNLSEKTNEFKLHAGSVRDIEGGIGDFRVNVVRNPIDDEKCISCGRCLDACSLHAIYDYPMYEVGNQCNKCGKCIDVCPVHAIDFKENIKTIRAGQILLVGDEKSKFKKKGIYLTKKGESAADTFRNALPAAIEIISNTGRMEKQKVLSISNDECAAGKSGYMGCRFCEVVCPCGAISHKGNDIKFDEISCDGCGACASICPLSHVQLGSDIYSKMEHLLKDSQLSPNILMFACSHSTCVLDYAGRKKKKYPPVLPLLVPCAVSVSEVHILRALDLGADGVITLGCKDCLSGSDAASKLAGLMADEFGLPGRIRVISNTDDADNFVGSVTAFSKSLTPSILRKHEPVKLERSGKREIMLQLTGGFAAKTGIIPTRIIEDEEYPFADIKIDKKCTVCGACTSMCPTGALKRNGGSIKFEYGYCIACGLCEKACPEAAMKKHRVLDLAKLVNIIPETLIEAELQKCAACKKPYMTAAAFDKIAGSLIENVRNDLAPPEQIELITNQVDLLKYCQECKLAKAISKMEKLL